MGIDPLSATSGEVSCDWITRPNIPSGLDVSPIQVNPTSHKLSTPHVQSASHVNVGLDQAKINLNIAFNSITGEASTTVS
jgi:hypothetical protein